MSHRNWLPSPPLGVGLCIILLLVVPALIKQNRDSERAQQNTAQQYEDSQKIVPLGSITKGPYTDPKAYRDEWREEQDLDAQLKMAKWAKYVGLIAILELVVTVVGVYYVAKTLSANWEAVKVAQDALLATREASEKQVQAYLVCNSGKSKLDSFRITPADPEQHRIRINGCVANKGQSPAHKIEIEYETIVFGGPRGGAAIAWIQHKGRTSCADVAPSDMETFIIDELPPLTDRQWTELRQIKCSASVSVSGLMYWVNEFGSKQTQEFSIVGPPFGFVSQGHEIAMTGTRPRRWLSETDEQNQT